LIFTGRSRAVERWYTGFPYRDAGTTSELTDPDTRRLIALEAALNFRDIGGYHSEDGRQTKWSVLYRADGLGRLTAADETVLRRLERCAR